MTALEAAFFYGDYTALHEEIRAALEAYTVQGQKIQILTGQSNYCIIITYSEDKGKAGVESTKIQS